MTYHAFRQRGAYGNRIPGKIDPKAKSQIAPLFPDYTIFWFDFSDTETLYTDNGITNVSANDDLIYLAEEKSGYSFDFIQGNSVNRPRYKTNVKNGLSACYLENSKYMEMASNLYNLGFRNEAEFYYVVSSPLDSPNGSDSPFFGDYNSSKGVIIRVKDDGALQVGVFPNGNYADAPAGTVSASEWFLYSSIWGLTTDRHEIYKNKSLVAYKTWTDNVGNSTVNLKLGARGDLSSYSKIYVGEILGFKGVLSDSKREAVYSYLNDKWDLY